MALEINWEVVDSEESEQAIRANREMTASRRNDLVRSGKRSGGGAMVRRGGWRMSGLVFTRFSKKKKKKEKKNEAGRRKVSGKEKRLETIER